MEPSVQSDFIETLNQLGIDILDFELLDYQDSMEGHSVQAYQASVSVKRKSTGNEKRYMCGAGSTWPADFEIDFRNGLFG